MMKMKRRNWFVGTLSVLTVATASAAIFSMNNVQASAATFPMDFSGAVDLGNDSTAWQSLTGGLSHDSAKTWGLVPSTTENFTATSKDLGGNSDIEIQSYFSATDTSGNWGVLVYYFKWNEGVDSVTWTWGSSYDFAIEETTNGIKASNTSGDWVALVMSYGALPFVIECNNGVIGAKQDIWQDGFGLDDCKDLFNQKTLVQVDMQDTASGVTMSIGYNAVDHSDAEIGVSGYTKITGDVDFTSSNTNLRGEGAVRLQKVCGAFDTAQLNAIGVKAFDNAGDYDDGSSDGGTDTPSEDIDPNDWAVDSTKWQVLSNASVNANIGLVPNAAANAVLTTTTNNITGTTTNAEITTTFKEGTYWGLMIYYFKWNEGVDSVTWSWGADPTYPLEGLATTTPNGLTATSSAGDWIALVVSFSSAPLVIECKGGVMQEYADNRIWANGFGDTDYSQLFNQTTKIKVSIADTETGIAMTATYDAIDIGVEEIGLNVDMGAGNGVYVSDNTALKGAGAISITRPFGNAPLTSNSKINVIVTTKEPVALATPSVTLNGYVASWTAVDGAAGYIYKIGESGEELETTNTFIELTDGQTLYVKSKGDGIDWVNSTDWSTPVTFEASAVATPEVTLSGNLATWTAIDCTSGYKYKIDDGEEQTTTETSVELLHGQSIVVMAVGNGTQGFDSGWSTAVTFTAPALESPTLTNDNSLATVRWEAIDGAIAYEYTLDDGEVQQTVNTYVSVAHNQVVKVRAIGDQKQYANSDWVEITYQAMQLDTPKVTMNANEAGWAVVEMASGYICKIDGVEQDMITENAVFLSDGQKIQVKAVGDGLKTSDSEWSTEIVYAAPALDAPYIDIEGNVATWEAVSGAQGYICEINGVAGEMISVTSTALEHGDVIRVKAVGDGKASVDSEWSNVITYQAAALATPNVTLVGEDATWETVTGATAYAYKIDNGEEQTTTGTSVALKNGQTIVVKALGNNTTNSDSAWSTSVTFTAAKLATPTLVVSSNVVSWAAVDGAIGYVCEINGVAGDMISATSIGLTDGQTLYVKAVGNGETNLDSDWSAPFTYQATVLEMPTPSISGNVVSWTAIEGATGYAYVINGGEEQTTLYTSVTLTNGDSVIIKTLGNGETSVDSAWTTEITFTATALAKPVVELNGNVATWAAVDSAIGYVCEINGVEGEMTSVRSVSLTHGQTLYVKAVGNGTTNIDSDWSDVCTYEAEALATPVIVMNGNTATWEAIDGAVQYVYRVNGGEEQSTNDTAVALNNDDTIEVKAIGNGTTDLDSAWALMKYTAPALATPVVTFKDGMASWEAVEGALEYAYRIDKGVVQTVSSRSVAIADGETIEVMAIGNDTTNSSSDWSVAATYTAPALTTPVVTLSGEEARWTLVENATAYVYKIDDGVEQYTTKNSVNLIDGQTITVSALDETGKNKQSAWSEAVTFTAEKLATPVVTMNGNVATWTAIVGANGYAYKTSENGEEKSLAANVLSVTLADGQTLYVKAVGNGETNKDSDWSAAQTFTAVALDAPNVIPDGNVAVWTAIDNAVAYVYKINGGAEVRTDNCFVALKDGESIVVKAVGNGDTYKDSDWSVALVYEASALTKPVVELNGNMAVWAAVDGANGYAYEINGTSATTNDLFVALVDGQTFKVMALGDGVVSKDSAWSEMVTYTAEKLATPVVVIEGNVAGWNGMEDAVGYAYSIDGGAAVTTKNTYVTLQHGQTLQVKALGDGVVYGDSAWSETITYTAAKLATPVLVLDGNVVGWETVVGASEYAYKIGESGEEVLTSGRAVTLTNGQTLYVKAIGDNKVTLDSEWSAAVTFTAVALETPVVTLNGNVATWTEVQGAVAYAYKIGDGAEQTSEGNSVALTDGQVLYVKALGDNKAALDSAWSAAVTFTAVALETPVVTLNGNVASWEEVRGAFAYAYKINDGTAQMATGLSVTLISGQTLQVQAIAKTGTALDSAWSTAVTYTAVALETPVITLNGNVASWSIIDGATGYAYQINDGEEIFTGEWSVALTNGQTLKVKALGNNSTALDSAWSETVTYTATTLQAPVLALNGDMATWTEVQGAVAYAYKIGESGAQMMTTEAYVILTDGQTLYVKALGDGTATLDSEWSAAVTYQAPTPELPEIPDVPETPDEPDTPVVPETPDEPETPKYSAEQVVEMIAAIEGIKGEKPYETKTAYTRAKAQYLRAKEALYSLTKAEQAKVSNRAKLDEWKTTLDAFDLAMQQAQAVDTLIAAIPATEITESNYDIRKTQIEKAQAAYDQLSDEAKALCVKKAYLDGRQAQIRQTVQEEGCGSSVLSVGGAALVAIALAAGVAFGRRKDEE